MRAYDRYQEYRLSGIEFIDSIPRHWVVKKLKFLTDVMASNVDKLTKENEISILLCNYTDVYKNNQITNDIDFMEATATAEEIEKFLLKKDDVIITKDSETADDIAVPTYVAQDFDNVLCGYHLSLIRPFEAINGKFLYYLFYSKDFNIRFELHSNGVTRFGLGSWAIKNALVPLPPLEEQKQIADFLDIKSKQIDEFIADKQALIALFEEQKSAVTGEAVTKGLNKTAPLKPSGIEWLGDIPSHWIVCAIKHIVSTPITDGPHETPNFHDDGIPFISAEAVSSGKIEFSKMRGFISEEDHVKYSKKYRPQMGDIYMVKSGATTGITAIVDTDVDFNIWSPLAVVRCNEKSLPYFVLNFMRSKKFQDAIALNWNFGTQQNIGMGVIQNLSITIPPLEEQKQIVEYLEKELSKIDTLIETAKAEITLIEEYKTSLINEAVTGKIKIYNGDKLEKKDYL